MNVLEGSIDPSTLGRVAQVSTRDVEEPDQGFARAAANRDYIPLNEVPLNIQTGRRFAPLRVRITDDTNIEGPEQLQVTLTIFNDRVGIRNGIANVYINPSDVVPQLRTPCEDGFTHPAGEPLDIGACFDVHVSGLPISITAELDPSSPIVGAFDFSDDNSSAIFTPGGLEVGEALIVGTIRVQTGDTFDYTLAFNVRPIGFECGQLRDNRTDNNPVPLSECIALLELFTQSNTFFNGVSTWDNNNGWADSLFLSDWYGVTLTTVADSAGNITAHVERLELQGPLVQNRALQGNNLHNTLPEELADLTELRVLNLAGNSRLAFENPEDADVIGELVNLRVLNLRNLRFNGGIPASIGNLVNLERLDLSGIFNGFTPELTLPPEIGNLTNLEYLDLSNNTASQGGLARVPFSGLGLLPDTLSNLTNLKTLRLGRNNLRPLPSSIGDIPNLEVLELNQAFLDGLEGPFPLQIFDISSLRVLNIAGIPFSGPLPAEIIRLTNLEVLDMRSARFSGELPEAITDFVNLRVLNIEGTLLEGEIPADIANLQNLEVLNLLADNLVGVIPPSIGTIEGLREFQIRSENLTGNIDFVENLHNLEVLNLGTSDVDLDSEFPEFRQHINLFDLRNSPHLRLRGPLRGHICNINFPFLTASTPPQCISETFPPLWEAVAGGVTLEDGGFLPPLTPIRISSVTAAVRTAEVILTVSGQGETLEFTTTVDEDGRWELNLGELPEGQYTLSVVQQLPLAEGILGRGTFFPLELTRQPWSSAVADRTFNVGLNPESTLVLELGDVELIEGADGDLTTVQIPVTQRQAANERVRILLEIVPSIGENMARETVDFTVNTDLTEFPRDIVVPSEFLNLAVTILDDLEMEEDEQFTLLIKSAVNGEVVAAARYTIQDNDPPIVGFSRAVYTVSEGDAFLSIPITLREGGIPAVAGNLTVSISVLPDSTAEEGTDYTLDENFRTVFLNSENTTLEIPLSIMDDSVLEFTETIQLMISADTPLLILSPTVTTVEIEDNEEEGSLSVNPRIAQANEGSLLGFRIRRTDGPTSPMPVDISIDPLRGSASDDDYNIGVTRLDLPLGVPVNLILEILNDEVLEGEENFILLFTSPISGSILAEAEVIIPANDELRLSFSDSTYIARETDGEALVVISTDGTSIGTTAGRVRVAFSTDSAPEIADDFIDTDITLIFDLGVSDTLTVSVPIIDDDEVEPSERFTVSISSLDDRVNILEGGDTAEVIILGADSVPVRRFPFCSFSRDTFLGLEWNLDLSECYEVPTLEGEQSADDTLSFDVELIADSTVEGDLRLEESLLRFTPTRFKNNFIRGEVGTINLLITVTAESGETWLDTITLRSEFAPVISCRHTLDSAQTRRTIPFDECSALSALYEVTDGENWIESSGWLSSIYIDEWQGVLTEGETGIANILSVALSANIVSLELPDNRLVGTLPQEIGNLSALITLDLSSDRTLEGDNNRLYNNIPSDIGRLVNLETLNLRGSTLDGSFPAEIIQLTNLRVLDISDPRERDLSEDTDAPQTGRLPNEIANLTLLRELDLSGNSLAGTIPSNIFAIANLQRLDISDTDISGNIPPALSSLIRLEELNVSGSQIGGNIPRQLSGLRNLELFNVDNTNITGNLPLPLCARTNLVDLTLASQSNLRSAYPLGISADIPCETEITIDVTSLTIEPIEQDASVSFDTQSGRNIYYPETAEGQLQTFTGSDAIPGALIRFQNPATGIEFATIADRRGRWEIALQAFVATSAVETAEWTFEESIYEDPSERGTYFVVTHTENISITNDDNLGRRGTTLEVTSPVLDDENLIRIEEGTTVQIPVHIDSGLNVLWQRVRASLNTTAVTLNSDETGDIIYTTRVLDGSSEGAQDYTLTDFPSTITVDGENSEVSTGTIFTFTALEDGLIEGTERLFIDFALEAQSVSVILSGAIDPVTVFSEEASIPSSFTLVIVDSDTGVVGFEREEYISEEGSAPISVRVRVEGGTAENLELILNTRELIGLNAARDGSDFVGIEDLPVLINGDIVPIAFLEILDEDIAEQDQSFLIELSHSPDADDILDSITLGVTRAIVTISTNDNEPRPRTPFCEIDPVAVVGVPWVIDTLDECYEDPLFGQFGRRLAYDAEIVEGDNFGTVELEGPILTFTPADVSGNTDLTLRVTVTTITGQSITHDILLRTVFNPALSCDSVFSSEGGVPLDPAECRALAEFAESVGGIPGWFESRYLDRWSYGNVSLTFTTVDGTERVLSIVRGGNNLDGVLPSAIGLFPQLTQLDLSNDLLLGRLEGVLPSQLNGLESIVSLRLNGNLRLSGPIPQDIGDLDTLETLTLDETNLSGEIPENIAALINLRTLTLQDTEITGTLPYHICQKPGIEITFDSSNVDCAGEDTFRPVWGAFTPEGLPIIPALSRVFVSTTDTVIIGNTNETPAVPGAVISLSSSAAAATFTDTATVNDEGLWRIELAGLDTGALYTLNVVQNLPDVMDGTFTSPTSTGEVRFQGALDLPAEISLDAGTIFSETDGEISISVNVISPPQEGLVLNVLPASFSAVEGVDYTIIDEVIVLPRDSTDPVPVRLNIIDDAILEGVETFKLSFVTSGDTVIATTKYSITDNDSIVVSFSPTVYTVTEGNNLSVRAFIPGDLIEESAGVVAATVLVGYNDEDTADLGSDYRLEDPAAETFVLEFSANQTVGYVNLITIDEGGLSLQEPMERLTIRLSSDDDRVTVNTSTGSVATVHITDNDSQIRLLNRCIGREAVAFFNDDSSLSIPLHECYSAPEIVGTLRFSSTGSIVDGAVMMDGGAIFPMFVSGVGELYANLAANAIPNIADAIGLRLIINVNVAGEGTEHTRQDRLVFRLLQPAENMQFNCNNALDIFEGEGVVSSTECLALLNFFNATNGNNWIDNSGWNESLYLSEWAGITVSSDIVPRDGNSHIVGISLPNNGLEASNLTLDLLDLSALPFLKTLDLSENGLTGEIPNTIGDLTALEILNLSNNDLSGDIPTTAVVNLELLEVVNLSSNRLSANDFDFLERAQNLRILNLSENLLGTPASAGPANEFTIGGVCSTTVNFPGALRDLRNLEVVDLSNNHTPESCGVANFSSSFNSEESVENLTNLRELHLNGNLISEIHFFQN